MFNRGGGWDLVVRCTHWLVAILFYTNYFYTEPGEWWHRQLGYTVAGLVVLRVAWGLTWARGANHLKSFVPTIGKLQQHFTELKNRTPPPSVGHNAMGAMAIYCLWLCLLFIVFSGWLQETDWGIDNDVDEWHRLSTQFLLYFSGLHVLAVLLTSWRLRRHLIKAMITGKDF